MPAPATITEGKASSSSLGARLQDALVDACVGVDAPDSYYERAAVTFTASLTYAESEGVREALLSSVLLAALNKARGALAYATTLAERTAGNGMSVQMDTAEWLDFQAAKASAESAIAQAEAAA